MYVFDCHIGWFSISLVGVESSPETSPKMLNLRTLIEIIISGSAAVFAIYASFRLYSGFYLTHVYSKSLLYKMCIIDDEPTEYSSPVSCSI